MDANDDPPHGCSCPSSWPLLALPVRPPPASACSRSHAQPSRTSAHCCRSNAPWPPLPLQARHGRRCRSSTCVTATAAPRSHAQMPRRTRVARIWRNKIHFWGNKMNPRLHSIFPLEATQPRSSLDQTVKNGSDLSQRSATLEQDGNRPYWPSHQLTHR